MKESNEKPSCCAHHDHNHDHNHDHSCCGHDHGHSKHLSVHDCSALYNQAVRTSSVQEKLSLLIEAAMGFAHLGDTSGLIATNAALKETGVSAAGKENVLIAAKVNALNALELALQNRPDKSLLEASVNELENFSGAERDEVAQLLSDVRKSLANVRTTGLKGLLSKLKLSSLQRN